MNETPLSGRLVANILVAVGTAVAVTLGAIAWWTWRHEVQQLDRHQLDRSQRSVSIARLFVQQRIDRGRIVLGTIAESHDIQRALAEGNRLALQAALMSLLHAGDQATFTLAIYDRNGRLVTASSRMAEAVFSGMATNPEHLVDQQILEVLVGDLTVTSGRAIVRDGKRLGWVVGAYRVGRIFVASLADDLETDVAVYFNQKVLAKHYSFPQAPPSWDRIASLHRLADDDETWLATAEIAGEVFDIALLPIRDVVGKAWIAVGISRQPLIEAQRIFVWKIAGLGVGGLLVVLAFVTAFLVMLRKQQERLIHQRDEAFEKQAGLSDRLEHLRAVVHDIKAPLGGIQLSCENFLEESNDPELAQGLQQIIDTCEKLNLFLINVLTMAEADEGPIKVCREVVLLPGLLEDVAERLAPLAASRGVALVCEPGDEVPALVSDGTLIERALLNLVSNSLAVVPHSGRVRLVLHSSGKRVQIRVEDDGPGFTQFDPEKAFSRDRPQVKDRSIKAGSSGLGLYIVARIAEALGGSASARNLAGGGCCVTLDLPFEAAEGAR